LNESLLGGFFDDEHDLEKIPIFLQPLGRNLLPSLVLVDLVLLEISWWWVSWRHVPATKNDSLGKCTEEHWIKTYEMKHKTSIDRYIPVTLAKLLFNTHWTLEAIPGLLISVLWMF
jgi:hypothetical protein